MLTTAVSTSSRSTLLPAALISNIGSLEVRPESWNAPMTTPASVVIATRSSIVRPVASTASRMARPPGRVAFWIAPTAKVVTIASMPALPASQLASISV